MYLHHNRYEVMVLLTAMVESYPHGGGHGPHGGGPCLRAIPMEVGMVESYMHPHGGGHG